MALFFALKISFKVLIKVVQKSKVYHYKTNLWTVVAK